MSIYKDSVQQDHKPVEIGGSRFIFRNDRLHELRPMKQPGGRGDFRSSIGKLEYDQACRAIHDKSVELHNHQKKKIEEQLKSAQRSLSLMQKSKFADDYQVEKQKSKIQQEKLDVRNVIRIKTIH